MQTWEDCIASIQAGASADDLLPKVRALFATLPTQTRTPPEAPVAESKAPVENSLPPLHVRLPAAGPAPFRLPYLCPPPFLWRALSTHDADAPGAADAHDRFDSELDLHVLEQFRPRFVAPPRASLRDMLDASCCGAHSYIAGGEAVPADGDEGLYAGMDADEVVEHESERGLEEETYEECERVAKDLSLYFKTFSMDTAIPDDTGWFPTLPSLSTAGWAIALSMLDPSVSLAPHALRDLLLRANQPALSLLALRSVLPCVMVLTHDRTHHDALLSLADAALVSGGVERLPVADVKELLDVYRGMRAGVLGALVQLRIVRCIR